MPDDAKPAQERVGGLSRSGQGVFFALLATVVWSFNFIASRHFAGQMPPITLAFFRWCVALCALLPFVWGELAATRRHYIAHWRYYVTAGVIGIGYFNTAIYMAAHSVPALNMSLIATTSPIFTIILARIFLGEPLAGARLMGMGAALCGILLLITGGDLGMLATLSFRGGDLVLLSSAFSFAVYTLLLRKKPEGGGGPFVYQAVTIAVGVAVLLPCTIVELALGGEVHFSPAMAGGLLYMGLGASLLAFTCWGHAVSRIGPARASAVYYSLPLFCAVEALVFLGEPVSWVHFASGALILGGLFLATRQRASVEKPEKKEEARR